MKVLHTLACCLLTLMGCAQPAQDKEVPGRFLQNDALVHIRGQLRSRLTDQPLSGVRVGWEGTNLRTHTDEQGRFSLAKRQGFGWLNISGAEVITTLWLPKPVMHVWTTQRDETLERGYLMRRPLMDSDPLDDPDLTERARLILRHGDFFDPTLPSAPGHPLHLKQALEPPATIRLYRRGPEDNSCEGRVDIISLEEYVRGVVPHEWIPSWHEESLRAGAIAARSYAWGWILAGGKLDCADLDDTTRSQVYEDTRNTRADVAVSSTAGVGIYDPARGQVVTSEYSAENADPTDFGVCEPLCTGETLFGHGRGMCQWGTSRWANRQITQVQSDILADCAVSSPAPIVGMGQIAEWMVSHYFPGKYTTELEDTGALLELSQGLERMEPLSCGLPERGFGCADFVPEGPSEGIFDTFVGQRFMLTYGIDNRGSALASEVLWTMGIPEGVDVEPSAMGGQWRIDNGVLSLRIEGLAAGARTELTLEVRVLSPGRKTFKPYIAQIQNQYDKRGWDSSPLLNVGQTYNRGDLRQLTEVDVFDPMRWDFRLEPALNPIGWYGVNLDFDSVDQGLTVSGTTGGMVVFDSPHLFGDRLGMDTLLVRSTDSVSVDIRYDGQEVFERLGNGIGARAFSISPQRSVFQVRLTGMSPFTVESVSFRNSVEGTGVEGTGAEAGNPVGEQDNGDAMTSISDAGNHTASGGGAAGQAPSTETGDLPSGAVRGSGACSQETTPPGRSWFCVGSLLLCGLRRRRRA